MKRYLVKTFPADMQFLYDILIFVREVVEDLGFKPPQTLKIEVAVEEVIVNIIKYGYTNTSVSKAVISINCVPLEDNKGISICIQDNGVSYNPLESEYAKRTMLKSSDEDIGGFGIFLVLQLMDQVYYKRENDLNILTLIEYKNEGTKIMNTPKNFIDISEETKDGILILRLQGRLDNITATIVEEQVLSNLTPSHPKLVLSLSGIEYMSSAGIRMLLSLNIKIKSLTGLLIICSINPDVLEIIKLTGFLKNFLVVNDEVEALQKCEAVF